MHATGFSGITPKVLYERKPKESHRETVSYEIDMLAFCFDKLPKDKGCERSDEYLYLEGFLLHYRNLLEFLSGAHHRNGYDISTRDPDTWANRKMSTAEIAAIVDPAKGPDAKYHQVISTYLQHCTLSRYQQGMVWDVIEMKSAIEPAIAEFERAFPR